MLHAEGYLLLVTLDDYDPAAEDTAVAQHLLDLGHRDIAVICGHLRENDHQRAILQGVTDALGAAGLTLDAGQVVETTLTIGAGREACRSLMDLTPRPSAILGLVDLLAIGAIYELQRSGLRVPQDVSIAGIDNAEFSASIAPSLTTISIPAAEIGVQAARRMVAALSGEAGAREIALEIALVHRQSSGPRPTAPQGGVGGAGLPPR